MGTTVSAHPAPQWLPKSHLNCTFLLWWCLSPLSLVLSFLCLPQSKILPVSDYQAQTAALGWGQASSERPRHAVSAHSTSALLGILVTCACRSPPLILYKLLEESTWVGSMSSLCLHSHDTISGNPKTFCKLKNKMSFNRNTRGKKASSKGEKGAWLWLYSSSFPLFSFAFCSFGYLQSTAVWNGK